MLDGIHRCGASIVALTVAVLVVAVPGTSLAQGEEGLEDYIRANYSKFEYWIPARDGARLYTSVYVPNDTSETYPMLMIRTPYSCERYGADRYPSKLGPSGSHEISVSISSSPWRVRDTARPPFHQKEISSTPGRPAQSGSFPEPAAACAWPST